MAKLTEREIQLRAMREAQQSSRGGGERQLKGRDPLVEDRKPAPEAKAVDGGRAIRPGGAGARVPPSPRETTTHQYRDPKKRKAYMREYMRGWRKRQAEQRQKEKQ